MTGRAGVGPLVLLVPVLLGVLAALSWEELVEERSRATPGPEEPPEEVTVFEATDVAGWARIRLAPLHADPRRQAFEAAALRRLRGWEVGEPWRLTLERAQDAPPATVPPESVRIEDHRGIALAAADPSPTGGRSGDPGGAPFDPLGVLLARAARGPVGPGEELQIVLWGRPPAGTPTWVAPAAGGGTDRLAGSREGVPSSISPASIPLPPRQVPRGDFPRHLARLETAADGPTAASAGPIPGE